MPFGAADRCNALREKAAAQPRYAEECGFGHAQKMLPGTRLLREYKGKTHEVIAVERGRFVYEGQVFRSLSEIARLIVGRPRAGAMFSA